MYPASWNTAIKAVKGQDDEAIPTVKLRSLMWRSALLNLAVVLTAFPVMAAAGGPKAMYPALVVLSGISLLIWLVTFAAFYVLSIMRALISLRMFIKEHLHKTRNFHDSSDGGDGLADHYLDGPV